MMLETRCSIHLYIYIYTHMTSTYICTHVCVYIYIYIYIWCPPRTYLFCVLHFLDLFSREIGGTFLGIGCIPFVLRTCFTCAVGNGGAVFGVDKRTCRYWIQYPGIGSNTRVFNFNTGPGQKLKIHWKVQHFRHRKGLTCRTFPKKNSLHNWLFRCFRDSTA